MVGVFGGWTSYGHSKNCPEGLGWREWYDDPREYVVRTGRTSSSFGREPEPPRRSHSLAGLEVPRPNHGLTRVVIARCSITVSGA